MGPCCALGLSWVYTPAARTSVCWQNFWLVLGSVLFFNLFRLLAMVDDEYDKSDGGFQLEVEVEVDTKAGE